MKQVSIVLFAIIITLTSCKTLKYKDLEKGVYADVVTNRGDILLQLYAKEVPMTVGNFVALAEGNHPKVIDSFKGKNYYKKLLFHRVIKDFMIQSGDYTGTGNGNAGYFFPIEIPRDEKGELLYKYDREGILGMANSGRNENSSQFYITHKPTPWLNGKYTIFGKVIKGQEVVDAINKGDSIRVIQILRIGKEAKKFDAVKAFNEGLLQAAIKEKKRLKKLVHKKEAFLKNMGIDKATKTDSGLKILTLKKGTGKKVNRSIPFTAFYTLYTAYGKLIQSNVGKQPFVVTMEKQPLMAGVTEAALQMREGGKVRLFIPSYLGYGERAMGPIPAKSDLVFELEITKVGK